MISDPNMSETVDRWCVYVLGFDSSQLSCLTFIETLQMIEPIDEFLLLFRQYNLVFSKARGSLLDELMVAEGIGLMFEILF